MLVNMKLTIAEMEADQTGERIKIVNEYKLSTGQPLSGSMTFGFMIVTDEQTGRKKIVKKPDDQPILEDAIQHYLTHQSMHKTVLYLHAKYHLGMSYASLKNLFKNSLLCGAYRDNPQYCEAYIDRETFNTIQEIMKRNVKMNTRQNRVYYFTGLIRCPECGCRLQGNTSVITRGHKKFTYKRYRCSNHRMQGRCDFTTTYSENVLERMMLANISQYLEDAKISSAQVTDSGEPMISKYNIDEIHAEIDRLNYSWRKGKIRSVEQYEKDYDDLTEQLRLAEEEQKKMPIKDFTKVEEILHGGWKEIYKALDDEHKRAFWRSFISSIDVEGKNISKVNFF
jgi:hypothetical protein